MLSYLEDKSRKRILSPVQGIDFTSNDYLGFSHSERIRNAVLHALENGTPLGAGGSRLLRGNHEEFEILETKAASFFESERALYFSNGYAANLAIFSTLPQRDDLILYDSLIHASIHDGISLGRAKSISIRHSDVESFETEIKKWRNAGGKGQPWIAVESIYSMDGDCAPLEEFFNLANQYDGFLVIDEAHATGVLGKNGRGLAASLPKQENVISLHTCGKALGASGAFICVNEIFYNYLINRARSFIYSTAPSPLVTVAVREALQILSTEPSYTENLNRLYTFANKQLKKSLGIRGSGTHILPIIIGENRRAVQISHRLQKEGFDVRAIRPPTVPEGTARLRISITLNIYENDIQNVFTLLSEIIKEELL